MNASRLVGLLIVLSLAAWNSARAEPPPAELLKLHTQEAGSYHIYQDEALTEELRLDEKSIFTWTNLAGESTQSGHLFVWMDNGRPAAVGTIFSCRTTMPQKRMLVHEFHTLSEQRLFPVTPETSTYQWEPSRGITIAELAGAPPVAESPTQRRQQMRSLARSFSAQTRSGSESWELRLLPTPLLQYEPEDAHVRQGALFAMVSSAGTDPEVLLLIEARRAAENQPWTWRGAVVRFSDKDLTAQ
jgi:hypothetical protein